jgi:plasmid maintenance system antidote protein VapI
MPLLTRTFIKTAMICLALALVLGKRSVTADTALRLARYFGTTPQFWLGLQADYDLDIALDNLGNRLEREVKVMATDA